jgi:hypothetical protein
MRVPAFLPGTRPEQVPWGVSNATNGRNANRPYSLFPPVTDAAFWTPIPNYKVLTNLSCKPAWRAHCSLTVIAIPAASTRDPFRRCANWIVAARSFAAFISTDAALD